jgi:hypothetical protein
MNILRNTMDVYKPYWHVSWCSLYKVYMMFGYNVRYKRFCDSNAHVTTYGTAASPNGRSSEWSLLLVSKSF